jgi:SHS2 domain-containing protein
MDSRHADDIDLPTSDIELRVWVETLEEALIAAIDATPTAMVSETEVTTDLEKLSFELREASRNVLFIALLQKLVRRKETGK